jgi:hypothetical protein
MFGIIWKLAFFYFFCDYCVWVELKFGWKVFTAVMEDSFASPSTSEESEGAENDENVEQEQVLLGIARSEAARSAFYTLPSSSLLFARKDTFSTLEPEFEPVQRANLAISDLAWSSSQDRNIWCTGATSVLMLPFSFWPTEDKESPAVLAQMILSRQVELDGRLVDLWERSTLPKESVELSVHFRELLGLSESSPVQRLRVRDEARKWLFGDSRLWAYTKSGDFVGKRCEWKDVQLLIFPHGAIVSVTVDWLPQGFSLAELRSWIYVAKFRSVKVGLLRGWSFGQRKVTSQPARQQDILGTTLFAALYGGSCVSLGSVVSWLISLPGENIDETRTLGFENCVHYTGASLNKPWNPDLEEDEYLPESVLWLRSTCVMELSLEEILGLEWGPLSLQKQFRRQLMGIYALLAQHCLSERTTLERLSYLAALVSRCLPSPQRSEATDQMVVKDLPDKDMVRRELTALAMMLAKYSSSMSSDDCGGRTEFREFFAAVRRAYGVGLLKSELRSDLRDTLTMVESDRNDEIALNERREMLYKKHAHRISNRKTEIRQFQKRFFEILVYSSLAVAMPFLVVCACFGMNNDDVPTYVPWGYVLLGCSVTSIFLFLVMLVTFMRDKPVLEMIHQEQNIVKELKNNTMRRPSSQFHKDASRRKVTFVERKV